MRRAACLGGETHSAAGWDMLVRVPVRVRGGRSIWGGGTVYEDEEDRFAHQTSILDPDPMELCSDSLRLWSSEGTWQFRGLVILDRCTVTLALELPSRRELGEDICQKTWGLGTELYCTCAEINPLGIGTTFVSKRRLLLRVQREYHLEKRVSRVAADLGTVQSIGRLRVTASIVPAPTMVQMASTLVLRSRTRLLTSISSNLVTEKEVPLCTGRNGPVTCLMGRSRLSEVEGTTSANSSILYGVLCTSILCTTIRY